jgi:hypothetical protein
MRPFRERQVQRPKPGFSPTAAIVAARVRCNEKNEKFTHFENHTFVKAVFSRCGGRRLLYLKRKKGRCWEGQDLEVKGGRALNLGTQNPRRWRGRNNYCREENVRQIKTVEGTAENRADGVSSRFQPRQPRAQVPTSNSAAQFRSGVPENSRLSINWPGRSCNAAGKEFSFPCVSISNDADTNTRSANGRFLARDLIAPGIDTQFARRRAVCVP